jgi:hypothetical protein
MAAVVIEQFEPATGLAAHCALARLPFTVVNSRFYGAPQHADELPRLTGADVSASGDRALAWLKQVRARRRRRLAARVRRRALGPPRRAALRACARAHRVVRTRAPPSPPARPPGRPRQAHSSDGHLDATQRALAPSVLALVHGPLRTVELWSSFGDERRYAVSFARAARAQLAWPLSMVVPTLLRRRAVARLQAASSLDDAWVQLQACEAYASLAALVGPLPLAACPAAAAAPGAAPLAVQEGDAAAAAATVASAAAAAGAADAPSGTAPPLLDGPRPPAAATPGGAPPPTAASPVSAPWEPPSSAWIGLAAYVRVQYTNVKSGHHNRTNLE